MTKGKEKETACSPRRLVWLESTHEARRLTIGGLAMMLSSYSNQAIPSLMGRLLDPLSEKAEPEHTEHLLIKILVVGLLGGTASFLRTFMLNEARDSIAARLRNEAFQCLLSSRDLEWFQTESNFEVRKDANPIGGTDDAQDQKSDDNSASSVGMTPATIGVILKEDVDNVAHTATVTVGNLLRSTSSCVFGTYHMLRLNPGLVGVSLAVAPLVGTLAWLTRKNHKKVLKAQHDAAIKAAAFLEERLDNIKLVKMSNRENHEIEGFTKIQQEYRLLGRKSSFANGISMGTMFFMSSTALCGILSVGGKAVAKKQMTHGQLVSFGSYSFLLALGSAGIVKALGEFAKGVQCAGRICHLIHDPDWDVNPGDGAKKKGSPIVRTVDTGSVESIEVQGVHFSYKCNPSHLVLRGVSLTVSRGEVLGVTGKNGSGKSTLASLLAGLHSPTCGKLVIRTKPLTPQSASYYLDFATDICQKSKAKVIQVVPQTPSFFNDSIANNVRYSNPSASEPEFTEALKAANCEGFVSDLKNEENYEVGRNGSKLSGGQRQRLGLARALLADPVCLVLDEPASSLDAEGETAVKDTIDVCRQSNRALIVISHDSKILSCADRVVVLNEGEVVEQGTLEELRCKIDGKLGQLIPDLLD